jgi:molybdopterin molybdotransferase
VAGLPGNPQSAVVALVTLVAPALAGWLGCPPPDQRALPQVRLGADIPGRGRDTYLALVRRDPDGTAHPLPHSGSAMLRGLARAAGFAVIVPGTGARAGDVVPMVPLPLFPWEAS